MIELIFEDRCANCHACVMICPTDVFDPGPGMPIVARQEDCQTCFMCELYCPHDAIYVGPDCERSVPVSVEWLMQSDLLGELRRYHGWDEWADDPRYANDHWRMEHVFLRARELTLEEAATTRQTGIDEGIN